MAKRIMTMQDLSCVGQCSLTVALPVLSAYGVEAAVLPTAVLSNHTMFKSWSYFDLTPQIREIYKYWQQNNFTFDGFLLGYLGKKELMNLALEAFKLFSADGAKIVIDPAFGDNGKLYGGFDQKYVEEMRGLIKSAHYIVPNITETCFLTGLEYRQTYQREYVERALRMLKELTPATVIITGVELDGKIGEAIYDGKTIQYVMDQLLPERLHGTGDIFAAVFMAKLIGGSSLSQSCAEAGRFVADCIRRTNVKEHFYGVNFEEVLLNRA